MIERKTCIWHFTTCHIKDVVGIPNLGKIAPLANNTMYSNTDHNLFIFLKIGCK